MESAMGSLVKAESSRKPQMVDIAIAQKFTGIANANASQKRSTSSLSSGMVTNKTSEIIPNMRSSQKSATLRAVFFTFVTPFLLKQALCRSSDRI